MDFLNIVYKSNKHHINIIDAVHRCAARRARLPPAAADARRELRRASAAISDFRVRSVTAERAQGAVVDAGDPYERFQGVLERVRARVAHRTMPS